MKSMLEREKKKKKMDVKAVKAIYLEHGRMLTDKEMKDTVVDGKV